MGNNEMVGPFGASSAFGRQAPPLDQVRRSLFLQQFRLGQFIAARQRERKEAGPGLAAWGGMGMFLENQVAPNDPRRAVVQANYRGNLEDIVRLGINADATGEYQETLRLNPDHALTHINLGTLLVQQARMDEAISHFNAALRIDPDNPVARDYLTRTQDFVQQSR